MRQLIRSLSYFRRTSLALIAGAAIATSVVAGALLVGDSVRASLRALTEERLGGIDYALAGPRFFGEQAVAELRRVLGPERPAAGAILLRGSAQHAETRARASQVGLYGVGPEFFDLYGARPAGDDPFAGASGIFPPVLLNEAAARALGAQVGDAILFSLQRITEVPGGSLLAREDTASVIGTVRLEVRAILPDRGLGAFQLGAHQGQPLNAYMPLAAAQKALEQPGKVNAALISTPALRQRDLAAQRELAASFSRMLDQYLELADFSVVLRPDAGFLTVESGEYVLRPALADALARSAERLQVPWAPHLTYLVNAFTLGERSVPYSTATALAWPPPAGGGGLRRLDASVPVELKPGQIVLGEWLANELAAKPGDRVRLDYFEVGEREELREVGHELEVAGIVAMEGLAQDGLLTQEYPGIAGSEDMSDWDPPFPIELKRVRPADEDYWDRYRGAPKAFVELGQGQELWRNRWGQLSGARILPPASMSPPDFAAAFAPILREELHAEAFGLRFEPVRALGLQAAGGATDFGSLFFGLSFFVIAAAALLVALLMSLMVDQRAGEIGLRLAVGFPRRKVQGQLRREGLLLALIGVLLGMGGAVLYAWAMMLGLRTFWRPAVGTSRLELFVGPGPLLIGAAIALVVTVIAIQASLRRIGRVATPQLLRKHLDGGRGAQRGRFAGVAAVLGIAGAIVLAAVAAVGGFAMVFPLAGLSLLIGLLAFAAWRIDRDQTQTLAEPGRAAWLRMAWANARRQRRRSLFALTLVALSTFLVVLVAAFQVDLTEGELGRASGAGGFAVIAEAATPIQRDLSTVEGRAELGLAEEAFAGTAVWPLRFVPGDDTSCLNLYQPAQPRLLGLPKDLIARGGFTFQQTAPSQQTESAENPWTLLEQDLGPGVVPVIGDANSTQWILKLPLGGELALEDERGEKIRLRLVATLATSIFQSELLLSEEQLLRHFPSRGGHALWLAETPPGNAEALIQALEAGLDRYGVDAEKAGDRLAAFHAVQNTYLSTFRSLGGLGLLLGTFGLAIVLVRNVLERRGELAALRAFGFRRGLIQRLVIWENAALLLGGLAIGTVAALLAAGGQILPHPGQAPWLAILATLAAIAGAGLAACWLAARGALAAPLMPALKAE